MTFQGRRRPEPAITDVKCARYTHLYPANEAEIFARRQFAAMANMTPSCQLAMLACRPVVLYINTARYYADGNVTSAGWQVTLCDHMWHVISRSSDACCKLLQYSVYWLYIRYGTIQDAILTCAQKLTSQLNPPHGTNN